MRAHARVVIAAAAWLAVGCPSGPSTTPSTTNPGDATASASLGADVLVQASGRGPGENEAYAAALHALATAVLGDAAWADVMAIEVHRRDVDPQRVTILPDGVEVALGLPRERAAQVVQALQDGEPEPRGPEVWREPLATLLRAHSAAQACRQRRLLFAVECEPSPTAEADAAVARLTEGLAFVSAYPDGAPVDAKGRALREPSVFLQWRGAPLSGLPLRVQAEDPSVLVMDEVVSNGFGQAKVALVEGKTLPSLRLVIDGEALLGPLRDAAPKAEIRIEPRAVGLGRWALVVIRGASPTGTDDEAAAAVRTRLRGSGLGEPQRLDARDEAALRATPVDRRAPKITALADAMAGRVDLLLLLTYDTRFASRMAGGRLWYEAEGTLEAYDAWTGRVRAKVDARVEADGVGDDRAAAAARQALAEALAPKLVAALREAGPR